jgi:predicted RNA-binding protein with TRAM domain
MGRVISKQASSAAAPAPAETPAAAPAAQVASAVGAAGVTEHKADLVQPGAIFDVKVDSDSRDKPGQDGVAHIEGLVVFVPGTHPGDEVRVRIVKRGARFAAAEVIASAPAATPAP